ncbi:VCBS repeat-containing protein [Actinoplanes sp. NBRC 103695]|uniref:FG-GAP repeat domain-containing protein n=1 Tax=Actinoplanes sp. NBRC 103695 TaxID=3032202 RepID=UPI0025527F8B|nr:VCBS repeat-containing protein [Actinoplanes sp. NBRC 103695]
MTALLVTLLPAPASAAAGERRDDYNRDGVSDLLAIGRDDGCLYLAAGDGTAASVGAATRVGCGWNGYRPAAVGDMNSDGNGDLMALTAEGSRPACLWRWQGDGHGGFGGGAQVGCGWENFTGLIGPGDITGDGHADLIAFDQSKTDPCLWRWAGDGQGGFAPAAVVNCGDWHLYRDLTAAGDINRDGRPDLIGIRRGTGCLFQWWGDGRGGFRAGGSFECGWAGVDDLTGLTDLNEDGNGDLLGRQPLENGEYALVGWYSTGFAFYSGGRELGRTGWSSMDLI